MSLQHLRTAGRHATGIRCAWPRSAMLVGTLAACTAPATMAQEIGPDPASPSWRAEALPLLPTRKVQFRVTEGTWISLDVSPDGQTIVFDLLGDLYTLPIGGGKATPITSGMAINQQPRFSPDGRHIVFVSDRSGSANVWISDSRGHQARQVSNLHGYWGMGVASPAWSPDGQTIVVSQKLGATRVPEQIGSPAWQWLLAAYGVRAGQMRWVSDTAPDYARSTLGPSFGPDAAFVYAAIDVARSRPWSERENWTIARIDLLTGRILPEMGSNVGRGGMRPAVSRDGRYLLYASSSGSHVGLRLRELRTDRERWLVREALADPPMFSSQDSRDLSPGYAFAPDSKSVIVAYAGRIHRIDLTTGRIGVIPFVAEVRRGLGPPTLRRFALPDTAVRTRSVMQPALSPDGNRVVFSALDRIWLMDLPQRDRPIGPPRRLTTDSVGEFYPSWAPDAQWIAYSTWVDGEGGAVRRVRVSLDDNEQPGVSERLTSDTAVYFHTAVSPDGERVVAVRAALTPERLLGPNNSRSGPQSTPTLVWASAAGGKPQTITSLTAAYRTRHRYPVDQLYFSADPDRVYVGLMSWRWDGTDQQYESVAAKRGQSPPWQRPDVAGVLAPNGGRALVSLTNERTLFELHLPVSARNRPDTIDLTLAGMTPIAAATNAAHRWGVALDPWISWSRDSRRVLFVQGGTLFVGDVKPDSWTTFARLDVPLRIPVDIPHGTLLLHGARLITMRGNEVIRRGDIVVQDNRILAIGQAGTVASPKGARVIDVSGRTILPGYVDVHDHMVPPRGVHSRQSWACLTRLAYGVTATRQPNPDGHDEFAYRERERTGDLLCPRLFSTGFAYNEMVPPIRTLDDAREAVRPNWDYFSSETFKVYPAPTVDRGATQLLVMALAEARLNGTVEGAGSATRDLGVVTDGFSGLEHLFPIRIYDDVATLIARSGTIHTQTYGDQVGWQYMFRRFGDVWRWARMRSFVPPSVRPTVCDFCTGESLLLFAPRELDDLLPLVSGAARIAAKGGRVGMGSHGELPGIGYHYEMWLHALGGMPNHEILRSATIVGATAIGHAKDLGSLEPGKLADLQILDTDPLADIHNTTSIRYVMKNGRLYQADDLTQVWPEYKVLPAIYRWDTDSLSTTPGGAPDLSPR